MTDVGMKWVFYLGGATALSGTLVMFTILFVRHGAGALSLW